MERRSFLQGFAALVGGVALEQAIPFNRVWSFPSQIVVPLTVSLAFHRDAFAWGGNVGVWRPSESTPLNRIDILCGFVFGEVGSLGGVEFDTESDVSTHTV